MDNVDKQVHDKNQKCLLGIEEKIYAGGRKNQCIARQAKRRSFKMDLVIAIALFVTLTCAVNLVAVAWVAKGIGKSQPNDNRQRAGT